MLHCLTTWDCNLRLGVGLMTRDLSVSDHAVPPIVLRDFRV